MKDLKKLEEQYKKLGEEIESLKDKRSEIDFSKWVGRFHSDLAIKGDNLLKSFGNGALVYHNENRDLYVASLKYEVVNLSRLEKGDIFVEDNLTEFDLEDFYIFVGLDSDGEFIVQYLNDGYEIETISTHFMCYDIKVKRFLRD